MGIFTASKAQVATYLVALCPFSIAFLVFLNSSVSFVITDLIGKEKGVGQAVGNLGFADELLALLACPLWGLCSDRVGVRAVCFIGYVVIAIALFVFVQARNVYPDLLLARLLFSTGGAAASTMVTAVLPSMSFVDETDKIGQHLPSARMSTTSGHAQAPSIASEQTITPASYRATGAVNACKASKSAKDSSSKIAGFVGMATGCGALIALSFFLPLPARFQKAGADPAHALQYSYYVVGAISLVLSVVCFLGLRGLRSEKHTTWRRPSDPEMPVERDRTRGSLSIKSNANDILQAVVAGFMRREIFVAYVGGFVARASSVAISLFIPLLVNAAFLSSDLCKNPQTNENPSGLPDIKRRCPRAYVVAAELTGVSQLVALLCAPIIGYWSSKLQNKTLPLVFSAACAIVGYPLFALRFDPDDTNKVARGISFIAVALIGISQIGAIVCSLSILSAGVLGDTELQESQNANQATTAPSEPEPSDEFPLLSNKAVTQKQPTLADIKGSVAGIYSFYGGAGILLLTKAGGTLFDNNTRAAPFYMMASFNALLLVACIATNLK